MEPSSPAEPVQEPGRPERTPSAPATPLVEASDATIKAARGFVYREVSARAQTPVLTIDGTQGSGKTCLALTIAGRMRPTSGRVRTAGLDVSEQTARVRRIAGIAGFRGIDDLEPSVSVADLLRERISWASRWYVRTPLLDDEAVESRLAPVFGNVPVPSADILARELTEAQSLLLRIALALVERPRVLCIDDIDQVQEPHERRQVLEAVGALARRGMGIVLVAADPRGLDTLGVPLTSITLTRGVAVARPSEQPQPVA